jgi:hypothetical protein
MILLEQIRTAIKDAEFSLTLHAQQQITSRHISVGEIRAALLSDNAEIIEDYPKDPRDLSCLVYGEVSGMVLHIHVSHPPEIVVVTAYKPDLQNWEANLKTRR